VLPNRLLSRKEISIIYDWIMSVGLLLSPSVSPVGNFVNIDYKPTQTKEKKEYQMKVKVAELGGPLKEVDVDEGATVQEVLDKANINTERSKELRINTEKATLDDEVEENDVIQLIPQVEGGR